MNLQCHSLPSRRPATSRSTRPSGLVLSLLNYILQFSCRNSEQPSGSEETLEKWPNARNWEEDGRLGARRDCAGIAPAIVGEP